MTTTMLFETVAERWSKYVLRMWKPSSQQFGKVTLSQLLARFGQMSLRQIRTETLQEYVSSSHLAPKTIINRITVMHSVWKAARAWSYVKSDPFSDLKLPRIVTRNPRCFTLQEVRSILGAAREPLRTIYLLAAETGMRGGELCGLYWSDVNLRARSIKVERSIWKSHITEPKTHSGKRSFCISEKLALALSRLERNQEGPVFRNALGTAFDSEKVVQRHLRPLLKALNIPRGGLHAFRHFNATLMDRESFPIKVRQSRLGHSSSSTTLQIYTHLVEAEDRRAADELGRLISDTEIEHVRSLQWTNTIQLCSWRY